MTNFLQKVVASKQDACVKTEYVLNEKVEIFLEWFEDHFINAVAMGNYQAELKRDKMKDFIEKMAVWYELRYPDNRVDEVLFEQEELKNEKVSEDEWWKEKFLRSLSESEKEFMKKPKYPGLVYLRGKTGAHFHLNEDGTVNESEVFYNEIENNKLRGVHIRDVVQDLKDRGIKIPYNSEVLSAVKWGNEKEEQIKQMLECVMYRIIERGTQGIGARRAFLFAKEYGTDINIPVKYGVYLSDPKLSLFLNEYLKEGGTEELICYLEYGKRNFYFEKLNKRTVKNLLLTLKREADKDSEDKKLSLEKDTCPKK